MRARFVLPLVIAAVIPAAQAAGQPPGLPAVADGWSIELVAQAPRSCFLPRSWPHPMGRFTSAPTRWTCPARPPSRSIACVAIKNGQITVFADKLWSVMGLEWVDGTLYVVHAPFLSAFRDTDGDGKADSRVDLVTGLGPKLPGFNGINDHIASGIRLGMDGFLYISVGDKGIPAWRGQGRQDDSASWRRRDPGQDRTGRGWRSCRRGERNPLSVALSATDDVFTYGNDDDSKKWPNSLTHHIVGGHYGYPYQFLTAPHRALPIMSAQIGGSGAQGICYNEDGLPEEYRGNLFFCDWGLQTVFRFEIKKGGRNVRASHGERTWFPRAT